VLASYPSANLDPVNPGIDLLSNLDKVIVAPLVDVYVTRSICLSVTLGLYVYVTCNQTSTGTAASVHMVFGTNPPGYGSFHVNMHICNVDESTISKPICPCTSLPLMLRNIPGTLSTKRTTVTIVSPITTLIADSSMSMYLCPVVDVVFEKRRKPFP